METGNLRHPRGGLYFEAFSVGQVFRHGLTRTVTQMDNMLFSNMTLNPQPLHIDRHFCEQETEWGQPLMNSLFTLGLMIGMLVVATGNPTFLLLVGSVILLNGATGLVKVALTRFLGIRVLAGVRFPLHDHCRKELGWSNTQVLVRFMLLHLGLSALLVILVLKIR